MNINKNPTIDDKANTTITERTAQNSYDEQHLFVEQTDPREPSATDFGPYSLSRRQ